MGKKKKRNQDLKPFCWYCGEREFTDLKVLIDHQRLRHFKCTICNRKLSTAGGLVIHMDDVHRERVPNAIPGRESTELEIFGMEGVPFEDIEKHKLRRDEESGRKKVKVETDPEVVREQFKKYQASIEGKVVAGPTVRVEVSDGISTPSYQSSSGMPVVGPSGIPVMATPGMPVVGPAVIPIPGLPVIPGITAIPGIPPLNIPGLPPGMMPPGPPPGLPGMPPPPTFMPPGVHLDTTSPPIHLPGMPVPPTFNPPSESLVKILNVIKVTRPFGKYQDGVVLVYGDEERSVEERRAEIFGYSQ